MHHRRLSILLGLCAAFTAGAAVIYKWTDADGVVHYSDQAVPGAEKVVTSSSSANGVDGAVRSIPPATTTPKAPAGLGYSAMDIESPAPEQVFFGDELVPIRLHLDPVLKPNHTIAWQLNGKPLDDQANVVNFSLQSLPRGTYSVSATVADGTTGTSQSTNSVTFYVRQPSLLAPLNKAH